MKLKKFNQMIIERDEFEEEEEDSKVDEVEETEEVEDIQPDDDDVIENLLSILRKMIKNEKFDKAWVFVDDEGAINIQFELGKLEKMSNIMKVMNLLKKLEADILIQYESEFDLWETKTGNPLLTGKFYYDEDVQKDNDDDDDDDDDENKPNRLGRSLFDDDESYSSKEEMFDDTEPPF